MAHKEPIRPMGRPPTDPKKLRAYRLAQREWQEWRAAAEAPSPKKAPPKKAPKGKPAKPAKAKAPKGTRRTPTTAPELLAPPAERGGASKEEKLLSAADLPAIIKLLQSLDIYSLRGMGFELTLSPRTENPGAAVDRPNKRPIEGASVGPGQAMQFAVDQEALRDMEMSQKLIDSPLEYEQAQIDAHLGQDDVGQQEANYS